MTEFGQTLGNKTLARSYNVLIVEDDPDDFFIANRHIGKTDGAPHVVHHMPDAKSACAFLETPGRLPGPDADGAIDVILLDLRLPDAIGFSALQQINQITNGDIPVIMLSGMNDDGAAQESLHLGAQDYLPKAEMTAALLSRSVRYAIERQKSRQQEREANRKLSHTAAELKKAKAELEELNAQKDRFFSIMAHDLRTPFNGVLGMAQLLRDDIVLDTPEQRKEYAELIFGAAESAQKLLEDLLEWSRVRLGQNAPNPEPFSVSGIVDNALPYAAPLAQRKGVEIINAVGGDAAEVQAFADFPMVDTVLRNLLSNAVKFTEPDGTVTVGANAGGDAVEIWVRDTGIGMCEKSVGNLFRLDSSVSNLGTDGERGTGMGLILCQEMVERNGGAIHVESTEGSGSTFTITLPRAANDGPALSECGD